jgi:hypothetical protein
MRSSLALAIFSLFLILGSTTAFGTSYTLVPPRIELNVARGTIHDTELIVLTSSGDEKMYFRFYVLDFNMKRDGTIEYAEPGSSERSASSWIKLESREFEMNPNEKKKIKVKITVPSAASGGYYSAIILDPLPIAALRRGASTLVHTVRMVCLAELKVSSGGALREEAAISGLRVEQSTKTNRLSVITTVENRGNVHIKGKGELVIRTKHGGKIESLPLVSGRGLVLPGASRDFSVALDRQFPSGDYLAEAVLDYGTRLKTVAKLSFSISAGKLATARALIKEGLNFTVDPYLADVTAGPGAFRTLPILVENGDRGPIRVSSRLRGLAFTVDGELVTPEPDGTWSCVDWIKLEPTEFELSPGEKKRVVVKISVPKDAVGGRFAHVGFAARRIGDENQKPDSGEEAGTMLLVKIPGKKLNVVGEITELRITQETKGKAIGFVASFKNNGNVHVVPKGKVVIKPVAGANNTISADSVATQTKDVLEEVQFAEILGAVLPGAVRHLATTYPGPLPAGQYTAEVTLDYGGTNPATMERTFSVR